MQKLIKAVEKYRALILEAERTIWKHPETGFREVKTSAYMAKQFEALGYKLTYADGIPGFYTVVDTGRPGPEVLVLGELDSIICAAHKDADPVTGAVHSCGHHAQCAALLGIAAALTVPGVLDDLCGRVRLCAVPAEELLEIEYRSELKKQGKIKYLGGKDEFLYRGYFDGADIAFMVHTGGSSYVDPGCVGCIAKTIVYKGKAAHAGAPWEGRNALYAATTGLAAVNAVRETFRDTDLIRVHPIITHGGDMVNAVPCEVRLESYVRGKTFEAIKEANRRVNRAFCGAALSMGTNVEIVDLPGYSPNTNFSELIDLASEAMTAALPGETLRVVDKYGTGSTDMGDLSCVMPTIHPHIGGACGTNHGSDYGIANPELACVGSAKWQVTMLYMLLSDGAKRAKQIIADYKPPFASKEEFLAYVDGLNDSGDRITYREDGTAEVRL